jgi:ankyrin repeat protein
MREETGVAFALDFMMQRTWYLSPSTRRRGAVLTAACLVIGGCTAFMEGPGTPLARAAHEGNIAEIRRLIAAGADPNQYDASRHTALHWAARGGHPPGPHECRGEGADRADVVETLIDLGADINAIDRRAAIPGGSSGWTPLHTALQHEQFKTAERLLQLGANADIRSRQGKTILATAEDEGAPRELLTIIVRAVR